MSHFFVRRLRMSAGRGYLSRGALDLFDTTQISARVFKLRWSREVGAMIAFRVRDGKRRAAGAR